MISNLIQPPKSKYATISKAEMIQSADTTAQNAARFFVNSMGAAQRDRFKLMVQSGAECGASIAQSYGVPLADFISEVQKIL